MATITTAQSGPWENTATWVGGVVPVQGDDVEIDHSVSVSDERACNNLNINVGQGVLIVADGVLSVYGDIFSDVGTSVVILEDGGILEIAGTFTLGTVDTSLSVSNGTGIVRALQLAGDGGSGGGRLIGG